MATIKFSAFSPGGSGTPATARVAGFKDLDLTQNYYYTMADLAAMVSPSIATIYSLDSSLTAARTVTMGAFGLTFSGNLVKVVGIAAGGAFETEAAGGDGLFKITNSGEFQLGVRASANSVTDVVIGSDSASTAQRVVSIGNLATTVTDDSINIGSSAKGTGATSITLNSSGGIAAPSTASTFGVYMVSNTVPDFEVVGGGTSTLNTNLKITGQGYTEQHDSLVGNATVDWNNGNVQYIQLASGANTFTPTNPVDGGTYILQVRQPAAGAAGTVTWGATVLWPAAAAPTLTVTNDYIDIITLLYNGTTSRYYATSVLNYTLT